MVAERYRIGDLEVDTGDGSVTRRQRTLTVSPLSLDLLVALAKHAPHVVRRQELLETVWPNEFVSDETLSQRVRLLRESLGDTTEEPRYLASVRGWGYKIVAPVERLEGKAVAIHALAVLPLANLTGDPQQEYFTDGMTEALISALAKIRALKVISRTSVMHYKHTERRLPQIARELGVDAVIEGAVLWAGERVRVSAQLVCATTDEHLWAESYDRDLGDVLSLHADLARAIAREVRAVVTPQEEERLKARSAVDPVAQDANLRARYFFAKATPAGAERAITEFKQAVARDPSFAEAHAGLANACFLRAAPLGTGSAHQHELLNAAKAAATTALELNATIAEAHASFGVVLLFRDWDWLAAERELECALELDFNSWYAHLYRAALAASTLDTARALCEVAHAVELDPLNLTVRAEAAEMCYWIRDYSQSLEYASQALELDSLFPRAHFVLGRVCEAQGSIAKAITEYERAGMMTAVGATAARRALQRGGADGYHRWALAVRLGAMGSPPVDRSSAPHVIADRPFFRARAHARLGEVDKAMRCLDQSYEERECLLVLLKAQEWWDPLRSDPRFEDLVRRVGIP